MLDTSLKKLADEEKDPARRALLRARLLVWDLADFREDTFDELIGVINEGLPQELRAGVEWRDMPHDKCRGCGVQFRPEVGGLPCPFCGSADVERGTAAGVVE